MPTYEYACSNNHEWEETQKIADPPVTACPTCGADARRLISRTSFALKGQGWGATGYGASPATPAAPAPTSGFSDAAVASATSCPTVIPKT